jgi:UDP-glucuronate 4-epimerase
MSKILITGAAGFIGYHVATSLSTSSDYEIVALDSFKPAHPTKLTDLRARKLLELDIKVLSLDLLEHSSKSLQNKFGSVDLVLHLAAFPGVRSLEIQKVDVLKNNIQSFEIIANFAREISSKLIYASSSSVYGDQGVSGPCKEIGLKEFTGKGDYAFSKWENEQYALKLKNKNQLESIGLRFFSVFGSFGREDMAYFKFANQILRNEPLNIYGSINDFRDYTPIEYVAKDVKYLTEFFLSDNKVIEKELLSKESLPILNIGSGQPKSLQDIIDLYSKQYGKKINTLNHPRQHVESLKTWSDNEKRNGMLPNRDIVSFEEALSNFIIWHNNFNQTLWNK